MTDTPAAEAAKPAAKTVNPPLTINLASGATLLHAIGFVATAIALRMSKSAYTDWVWKHATHKVNNKTVHYLRSNPKDVHTITSNVSKSISSVTFQAVVSVLVLTMLAFMLRRTRGATVARWTIVLFSVLLQSPFLVLNVKSDLPTGLATTQVWIGVFSIAAIVLLFVPSSSAYFREVRGVTNPGGRQRGGLFAPRPRPTTSLTKAAPKADEDRSTKATQHKQRAEAAAVAKGAELARSRAKAAAKSRRMED